LNATCNYIFQEKPRGISFQEVILNNADLFIREETQRNNFSIRSFKAIGLQVS
jgi:hypothetical protein